MTSLNIARFCSSDILNRKSKLSIFFANPSLSIYSLIEYFFLCSACCSIKHLVQIFILDKNGDILKSKCFFYGEKTKTKLMKLVNQEYNKYKNLLYHTDDITLDDYDILNLDK